MVSEQRNATVTNAHVPKSSPELNGDATTRAAGGDEGQGWWFELGRAFMRSKHETGAN